VHAKLIMSTKDNMTDKFTGNGSLTKTFTIKKGEIENKEGRRLVVVRYFLDRPGYGLHNSAARLWFDVPIICHPRDIRLFLAQHSIDLQDLIVEIFMDGFGSYMLLDACDDAEIEWNFEKSSISDPGILILRFTDTESSPNEDETGTDPSPIVFRSNHSIQQPKEFANSTPIGVFAFAMIVGLDNAMLLTELTSNATQESFILVFGPYGFFVGGLLQLITGLFEVVRNNIYGGVAFSVFGGFWLANGTRIILQTHFTEENSSSANEFEENPDKWGKLIMHSYILAFVLTLLKQTLIMNKLSTLVIVLLSCYVTCQLFTPWSEAMKWVQIVFGFLVSWSGFYLFVVEFTNNVYHREVFNIYPWSVEHSPTEAFGAPGKSHTLISKAARLRRGSYLPSKSYHPVLPKEE
jgi:succinate-acetate transporter protein